MDYWFLGRYLTALKQTLGYSFPLFALTATAVWNPKGGNDMIFEPIRSLQMEPGVLYVGTLTVSYTHLRQSAAQSARTLDKWSIDSLERGLPYEHQYPDEPLALGAVSYTHLLVMI